MLPRAANRARVGKRTVAIATEKIPCGSWKIRKALSIAAGASSQTRLPKKLLIRRLKLTKPRLVVTGSISSRTLRTPDCASRSSSSNLNGVLRRSQAGIASWTTVPARIPIA